VSETKAKPTALVTPGALQALVGLGGLAALWSLFLWGELLRSRGGAPPFCPLGDATQCSALWDGAFARAVHAWTGLPVAGWGLVWGLAATALPLLALRRMAEGRTFLGEVSGIRLMAAAGALGVFVLGGAAAAAGAFCASCFATYLIVAGYAGIALFGWQPLGLPEASAGARLVVGALAASFAVLLYPGMRTPKSSAAVGRDAVAGASGAGASGALASFVASLAPGLRQTLADSLHLHKNGIALPPEPPRALLGDAAAPVRVTEFTDVLCDHCAELHETLAQLKQALPPGSVSIEPRQFPLDAECNPSVQRSGSPVRCLAAKAQICLEGHERLFEFSGALFAKQKTLTSADVYSLAAPFQDRARLEACVKSDATNAKLQDDIRLAMRYELDGTPLVLLNGRKAVAFPPFLYAMALTRGRLDDPAFATLPPANPNAHIH
jgi:serine/threonine-protein kinase